MKTAIEKLKERFVNAETEEDIAAVDRHMKALADEDINAFSAGLVACAEDTNRNAAEVLIRERLESILPFISVSALARTYFKRSPQWFYQRLNGGIVNGKPARFNATELKTLSDALFDIGHKISQAATFVI